MIKQNPYICSSPSSVEEGGLGRHWRHSATSTQHALPSCLLSSPRFQTLGFRWFATCIAGDGALHREIRHSQLQTVRLGSRKTSPPHAPDGRESSKPPDGALPRNMSLAEAGLPACAVAADQVAVKRSPGCASMSQNTAFRVVSELCPRKYPRCCNDLNMFAVKISAQVVRMPAQGGCRCHQRRRPDRPSKAHAEEPSSLPPLVSPNDAFGRVAEKIMLMITNRSAFPHRFRFFLYRKGIQIK